MKRSLIIIISVVLVSLNCVFAVTKYYFYVQLKDKNQTPYSLNTPQDYLSQRAIERRLKFNLAIDSLDLPINQTYVSQIASKGVSIHCKSKWMNGVTILTADSTLMSQVRTLPCVKWAKYTGKIESASTGVPQKSKYLNETYNYGSSATQINQVNGAYLHNLGYTGKNIHVAVLDAGFTNANINPGLDSLRLQGRLLGTKDFSETTPNIYSSDSHGANVLTIMTGNLPNQFLGAAPHASFWLIRTEYSPTEYLCETDFWVSGIEFADSVGVDVVNSSLGYTTFDDASMDYTYSNMNGLFSRASRAATIASQKGIIVCNSAGNDGNKTWHYIGVPADASGIITAGAVDATGAPSTFTSYGPSADGRQKPDLSAMGTSTAYIATNGVVSGGSGTSYSSPLLAGLMSCFLQYANTNFTTFTVESLLNAVKRSASLYTQPTDRLGYGLPNFQMACAYLPATVEELKTSSETYRVFQNNANEIIIINIHKDDKTNVSLYSLSGRLLYAAETTDRQTVFSTAGFSSGIYILKLTGSDSTKIQKLIVR